MRQFDPGNIKLIYVTYHVDVGESPFLVGVDYLMKAVVVSIRGTLSLKVSYMYLRVICPNLALKGIIRPITLIKAFYNSLGLNNTTNGLSGSCFIR